MYEPLGRTTAAALLAATVFALPMASLPGGMAKSQIAADSGDSGPGTRDAARPSPGFGSPQGLGPSPGSDPSLALGLSPFGNAFAAAGFAGPLARIGASITVLLGRPAAAEPAADEEQASPVEAVEAFDTSGASDGDIAATEARPEHLRLGVARHRPARRRRERWCRGQRRCRNRWH